MIQIFMLILLSNFSFASGDVTAGVSTQYGAGKAVEAYSKEDGFKLSEKAIKNLGVKFIQLDQGSKWKVPASALVSLKQSFLVYRRYDGWLTTVLVKVVSQNPESVTISSEDLQPGDEVVTTGVNFVRMTDSDLNSGTVDSCSH